jgi:DNA-binding transcriptional LysR family regulator
MLADELHFGRAAEKLFMAQPPLSRTIKELEKEMQVKLFIRHSRKVELTDEGIFLRDEVRSLFARMEQVREQIRHLSRGSFKQLRVGYVGSAMHSILPGVLNALKKELDIHIVLTELKNREHVEALRAGQIDIGFLRNRAENKDLVSVRVFTETFSLILPLGHPLAQKNKIALLKIAEEPYVGLNYYCVPVLGDAIRSICRQAGFSPRVAHETSEINSIARLVESGMGYSIVPTSMRTAYAGHVRFIELKQYQERAHLFLMYKKEMKPVVKESVDLIKRLYPDVS